MSSVGFYLRELRQRRGVSIDELSRATRVSPHYLQALEADDLGGLPAPVFTRGFIRAYCEFLGEPADEALARFAHLTAAPASQAAPRTAAAPAGAHAERERRGRGTVLVSFVLLVILGVALFAVTLVLNGSREDRKAAQAPPADTATTPAQPAQTRPATGSPAAPSATPAQPPPEAAAIAGPAPAASAEAPRSPVAPPREAPVPAASGRSEAPAPAPESRPGVPPTLAAALQPLAGSVTAPYRLVARTVEATWIRVVTEDGRVTEETIPPGERREWASSGPFVVTVGNAGGVTLELNGQVLPPLGGRGAVIPRLVLPPPRP